MFKNCQCLLVGKTVILTLILCISGLSVWAKNADSLILVLNTAKLTSAEQMSICQQLCGIYSENDIDKCNFYAHKGLLLAEKENNKLLMSAFSGQIGVNYYTKSIYDTAVMYLQKSLTLAIESKDKTQESSANTDLGNAYRRQADYEKAIDRYMRSMAICDSMGDKNGYGIALINIGGIHEILRNYERATFYFRQAEEVSRDIDNKNLQMTINYRLGNLYSREKDYEKAIEYALKSNEISKIINNKKYEIASLNVLTTAYANMHEYAKSAQYGNKCVELAEEYGDKRMLMGVLSNLSDTYMTQHMYKECTDLALRTWTMDSTDLVYATDAAWTLSLANINLGNKEKASYFLYEFHNLILKRTDKNVHDALIDMEVKYEAAKKETQIDVLKKEKQLYIWLGIAGVSVLLLILIILFYRNRQLRQEKQLIATQAVLDGEAAERSRLAKDLHDGLGGMLSVIKLNLKDMNSYSIMESSDVSRFDNALQMLDQSIGELRRVAHHMMPESLMRYGLKVSLEDFCRAIPAARFQFLGNEARIDSHLEVLIYRCAYELVNNAVKHANATNINVQLIIDNGVTSLTVQDNGVGFDPRTVTGGAGLENIRTRVSAHNGKMNIYSSPGNGTEVNIEIEKV